MPRTVSGRFDAIVAGAGPAGSAAAITLARRGLRVALVDRTRFPRDKLCGGFVSGESLSALARLVGTSALSPASYSTIRALALYSPSGRTARAELPALRCGAAAWSISRRELDHRLVESAAREGATLLTGLDVTGLSAAGPPGPSRTVVRTRTHGGATGPDLSSEVLIAADGRHSRIARLLDASSPRRRAGAFGLQAFFEAPEMPSGVVEIHFLDGGYLGLQAVGHGRVVACGLLRMDGRPVDGRTLDGLLEEMKRRSPSVRRKMAGAARLSSWSAVGALSFGPNLPVRQGVLFAGDAAGTIEPFTGEGITMALASGGMAARCCLPFLSGRSDPAAPARAYARAWRRAFLRRLRVSRLLAAGAARPYALEPAMAALARSTRLTCALFSLTRTPERFLP